MEHLSRQWQAILFSNALEYAMVLFCWEGTNIQTWSDIPAHLVMKFSVVARNEETSSSLGHWELR